MVAACSGKNWPKGNKNVTLYHLEFKSPHFTTSKLKDLDLQSKKENQLEAFFHPERKQKHLYFGLVPHI